MATLNISDKQKERVVAAQKLVQPHFPINLSQADVVEIGIALIEKRYAKNAK
jgi:hypothetical protein